MKAFSLALLASVAISSSALAGGFVQGNVGGHRTTFDFTDGFGHDVDKDITYGVTGGYRLDDGVRFDITGQRFAGHQDGEYETIMGNVGFAVIQQDALTVDVIAGGGIVLQDDIVDNFALAGNAGVDVGVELVDNLELVAGYRFLITEKARIAGTDVNADITANYVTAGIRLNF